ncbi:hypothetical protein BDR26DRAFT_849985 [Obelidium mucronatum]|nr:hypothetical protein BDR26DRAFT_849985 [Obelidium mucronatum]
MAPYLQHFEVVGKGSNIRESDKAIIVEAGWDTESTIEAAVLLKVGKRLKYVRIQAEFRGYCETRWENGLKVATRPEASDYRITRSGRVFKQLVEVVYDSSNPIEPSPSGESHSLPFAFKLPRNGLPPSFENVGGAIQYYIKCSMLYQEGMKLLKSSIDFDVPVVVLMPEAARLKLLQSPSQMTHQVASSDEKIGYSVQIPKRILSIGERLEVNVMIFSTPGDAKLRLFNASLRPVAQYMSPNNYGAHGTFPRPLAEVTETFNLVQVGDGAEPIVRHFFLDVDPAIALASLESPLISIKTVFRLQVTLDNSETPNSVWELPVVVLPVSTTESKKPVQEVVAQDVPAATPTQDVSASQQQQEEQQYLLLQQQQQEQYLQYQLMQQQLYQAQVEQYQAQMEQYHQQQKAAAQEQQSQHSNEEQQQQYAEALLLQQQREQAEALRKQREQEEQQQKALREQQQLQEQQAIADAQLQQQKQLEMQVQQLQKQLQQLQAQSQIQPKLAPQQLVQDHGANGPTNQYKSEFLGMTPYDAPRVASPISRSFTTRTDSPAPRSFTGRTESMNSLRAGTPLSSASTVNTAPAISRVKSVPRIPSYASSDSASVLPAYRPSSIIQSNLNGLLAELEAMELPGGSGSSSGETRRESTISEISSHQAGQSQFGDSASIMKVTPRDTWSPEEVADWVRSLGCSPEAASAFIDQEIDGSVLKTLSADDLKNELGISALGMRRKILAAIAAA